jgi:alcohol dehydrogenase class IV
MNLEFATASRFIFGSGRARDLPELTRSFGSRLLIVTGNHGRTRHAEHLQPLQQRPHTLLLQVAGEPNTNAIQQALQMARAHACDSVLALGGGSVIDAGKALAGLLPNPGHIEDYLEVIGRGQPLRHPALPFIALPTTAGAGAEVTRNAVLLNPQHRVKVSLRSLFLLPRVALVDPGLTLGLPPALTASTGMDALTQLIEAFLSCKANPLTDAFCREGIPRATRALPRAFTHGHDLPAREDLSLAASLSGMALANAGLGAVHGFAAPIGGMFNAPHGAVCASLLPHVIRANLQALRQRHPDHPILPRFTELARLLTGTTNASADAGLHWIDSTCASLQIPTLRQFGLTPGDIPLLREKGQQASSMRGNPVPLLPGELDEILLRAIG